MVMGGDCYNYAMLATGFVDVVCESGLKLYDFAALVPVVEGAGGTMCDWNGEPLHAAPTATCLRSATPRGSRTCSRRWAARRYALFGPPIDQVKPNGSSSWP
jgi:fructose-1,6-bisphosphatase/inositol monophosphatase family enzyme